VVVIGGGPVGSYVAYKLAELGHEVVILEKKPRLGEKVCCTGIISRECVNSFAVDERVILRWINDGRVFGPSGRSLRLHWEETQGCVIDRAAFDMSLASRAQDKGAEYILNSLAKDIEIGDDRVRVEATCHGERLSFEARVAVITTGFGSRLSEKLWLSKIGDFVIGAQAEVETGDLDEVEVYLGRDIAPGFFGWLVPTSPQRALVGLLSRHKPGLYLRNLMSSLVTQGKIASAEVGIRYRAIPLKPLPRTHGERVVVVGDAAGQVKPTTGGGIYYGLLCAEAAANTLHQALETNTLSAKSLAKYKREWEKRLGRELRIGYRARKLSERLSDKQIDRIFDMIKSSGIDETLLKAERLPFDWHGEVILKLLGRSVMSKVVKVMKTPFYSGGRVSRDE